MSTPNIHQQTRRNLTGIGKVAARYNIKTHIIRYWEKQIDEIVPLRVNKRRFYTPEQVTLIGQIKKLIVDENYTLKGACEQLSVARKKTKYSVHIDTNYTWLNQLKASVDRTVEDLIT